MTTTPLPQPAATYVLSIVADSGYESTMEGRCDAEQYGLAVKALHEPAQARADLEAENARLLEALELFDVYVTAMENDDHVAGMLAYGQFEDAARAALKEAT